MFLSFYHFIDFIISSKPFTYLLKKSTLKANMTITDETLAKFEHSIKTRENHINWEKKIYYISTITKSMKFEFKI